MFSFHMLVSIVVARTMVNIPISICKGEMCCCIFSALNSVDGRDVGSRITRLGSSYDHPSYLSTMYVAQVLLRYLQQTLLTSGNAVQEFLVER